MLKFLHRKKSERKQRLFACACCRLVWPHIPPEWYRAVDIAEKYADGQATKEEVREARAGWSSGDGYQAVSFACNVTHAVDRMTACAAYNAGRIHPNVLIQQAAMLRDMFLPFRRVRVSNAVRTATVVALAEAIYVERAFDRLPILADALEEAGCTSADLLNHCRQSGEHVRGCWAVDLLLGKA